MNITINKHIKEQLRQRIETMSHGVKFPTESELCAEFSVSRMTVNKAVKELAAEGLLVRNRPLGTFVNKNRSKLNPELSAWIEHSTPIDSVFSLRRQVFEINIDECIYDFRLRMWERILSKVESIMPRVKFKINTEPSEADQADLILSSLRYSPSKSISTADNARKAVYDRCPNDNYFAPSWTGAMNHNLAACPFAVSSDIYIWNLKLLRQHFPAFDGQTPIHLIDFVMNNCDWKAESFPPVASFIFYPPIQWATEGIKFYDEKRQRFDLSDGRIRKYLEFNRYMANRTQSICKEKKIMNAISLLNLFNNGQLLAMNTYSSTLSAMRPALDSEYMMHSPSIGKYLAIVTFYLGIGCNCRRVEAAADIIALICGEAGQKMLAEEYGNIPALRQIAYSPEFLNNSPHNMRSVLQTIDQSESLLDKYPFLIIEQPFFEDFFQYILGEIDFDELKKTTQQQKGDTR